jgi:hypothetical protein
MRSGPHDPDNEPDRRRRARIAARVMTVAHTARKQHKDALAFLAACCQAQLDGTRARASRCAHRSAAGGTYATIWRRQPDGAWKVLFDTGRVQN